MTMTGIWFDEALSNNLYQHKVIELTEPLP